MDNQEIKNNLNNFFQEKLKYDILISNFNKLDKKVIRNEKDDKKYKKYRKKINNKLNFVITDEAFELVDDNNDVVYSCERDLKISIKDYIEKLKNIENNIKTNLLSKKYNILYEYENNNTKESLEKTYKTIESLESKHYSIMKNKEKIIKLESDENDKLHKMYQDLKLSKLTIKQELLLIDKENIEEKKTVIKNMFAVEKNIQELLKIIKSDKIYEIKENI